MTGKHPSEFVAECLWPDVSDSDLQALDERVTAAARRLAASGGGSVRYLGSVLVREDEIVWCQFTGDVGHVRRVADDAAIPYERILETARSPWRAAGGA